MLFSSPNSKDHCNTSYQKGKQSYFGLQSPMVCTRSHCTIYYNPSSYLTFNGRAFFTGLQVMTQHIRNVFIQLFSSLQRKVTFVWKSKPLGQNDNSNYSFLLCLITFKFLHTMLLSDLHNVKDPSMLLCC